MKNKWSKTTHTSCGCYDKEIILFDFDIIIATFLPSLSSLQPPPFPLPAFLQMSGLYFEIVVSWLCHDAGFYKDDHNGSGWAGPKSNENLIVETDTEKKVTWEEKRHRLKWFDSTTGLELTNQRLEWQWPLRAFRWGNCSWGSGPQNPESLSHWGFSWPSGSVGIWQS